MRTNLYVRLLIALAEILKELFFIFYSFLFSQLRLCAINPLFDSHFTALSSFYSTSSAFQLPPRKHRAKYKPLQLTLHNVFYLHVKFNVYVYLPDERFRTATAAAAGQFKRFSLSGRRIRARKYSWWSRRCQYSHSKRLRMQISTTPRSFQTTFELSIISFVTRIRNEQIITTLFWSEI